MATIGTKWGRFLEASRAAAAPAERREVRTRVRPFANEDIYFYVKHIDNSAVVRQADPDGQRASWKMIVTAAMAAGVMVAVLMPEGYSLLAGYRVKQLKKENARLVLEQGALRIEEAALLTPERMLELAKQQHFVDPPAERIVYLNDQTDVEFASALPGR